MSINVNFSAFSAEQLKFMIALADPEDHRTQKEIAAELNVRPETLCRWKKEVGFGELVWQLTYQNFEAELGRVSAVLLQNALSGDVRCLRLYYELLGKIGSQKSGTTCTREHVLSDQEVADGLRAGLTERQFQHIIDDFQRMFPEFVGGLVDGDELSLRPYEQRVWVNEAVKVSITA